MRKFGYSLSDVSHLFLMLLVYVCFAMFAPLLLVNQLLMLGEYLLTENSNNHNFDPRRIVGEVLKMLSLLLSILLTAMFLGYQEENINKVLSFVHQGTTLQAMGSTLEYILYSLIYVIGFVIQYGLMLSLVFRFRSMKK